jgi:hypothetical protein
MCRRVTVLATLAVAVAALGAGALGAQAASSAADPSRLMLSRSDFPSNTKYTWGRMPANFTRGFGALGVKATGAFYAAELRRSGSTKYESVQGLVVTTGSAAQARAVYRAISAQLQRQSTSVVRLPVFGDEQIALYQTPKLGSKAELLVRRNGVVWQLQVSGEGLLVIPKPKLLAELKEYATKQKTRIGTG